ncbi:MAG: hypothetical protein O7D34_12040 [Ignavibacteria bacterium]|nr:hypothetical protein [Ignavibacteria bacterium]
MRPFTFYILRSTHRAARIILIITCLYCGMSGKSFAETSFGRSPNTFRSTLIFQTWKLTPSEPEAVEERLSQVALPIFGKLALSPNMWLYVSQSNATMRFDAGEVDDSLSGVGDAKLKFAYEFPEGRVRLTTGVSVPTGKNLLSPLEVDIANQFYSEVLGFPVNRLGEGVDLHLAAAATQPIASLVFSGGVSHLHKGSYDVMEGAPHYEPGNQFQAAVGARWDGNRIAWQSNLTYTRYGADRFDDQIWFEQGDEMRIESTVRWVGRVTQFELMHREFLRGKNHFRTTADELSAEFFNTNGNRREIALWGGYKTSPIVQIHGGAEYQSTRANEKDEGESTVWQFTIGVDFQMTDRIKAQMAGRFATGEMRDGAVDLRGLGAWFGISSGFGG